MDCRTALEKMLEAEPSELTSSAEGELGRHLRGCQHCRLIAAQILNKTALLDEALSATPADGQDAAITRFRGRTVGSQRVFAALAIAASVTIALFAYHPLQDQGVVQQPAVAGAPADNAPIVEDVGGANLALFTTDDPNITIVWIY